MSAALPLRRRQFEEQGWLGGVFLVAMIGDVLALLLLRHHVPAWEPVAVAAGFGVICVAVLGIGAPPAAAQLGRLSQWVMTGLFLGIGLFMAGVPIWRWAHMAPMWPFGTGLVVAGWLVIHNPPATRFERALRRGAASRPARAGVDLVIASGWTQGQRGHHLGAHVNAAHRDDGKRTIGWSTVLDAVDLQAMPGTPSELRVLRIAASLCGGGPIDVAAHINELDRWHRLLVRGAMRRAMAPRWLPLKPAWL